MWKGRHEVPENGCFIFSGFRDRPGRRIGLRRGNWAYTGYSDALANPNTHTYPGSDAHSYPDSYVKPYS